MGSKIISCPSDMFWLLFLGTARIKSFILFRNWSADPALRLPVQTIGAVCRLSLQALPIWTQRESFVNHQCRLTAIQQYCPQRPCTILHPSVAVKRYSMVCVNLILRVICLLSILVSEQRNKSGGMFSPFTFSCCSQ